MGKFLEAEKERYIEYKATSPHFPDEARVPGIYKSRPREFCLPQHLAAFNLFDGIRDDVQAYFREFEIKWHDGRDRNPSNHLCDSQVCCVNFLYPFSRYPDALATLLRPIFPALKAVLNLERRDSYVSHEWIGKENYLGEKLPRHGKRTRGANFTSADAAVMFEEIDGCKHLLLIEWKYTETYSMVNLKYAKSGTDRTEIYRHLYDRDDYPLDKGAPGSFDAFFFEPFYQLMRQQLLANEMEKAKELGADCVSVLHIAPARNVAFNRVTSPGLVHLGNTAIEVWKRLVRNTGRFHSASVEQLFGSFDIRGHPEMQRWWNYAASRYSWFNEVAIQVERLQDIGYRIFSRHR